MKKSTKQIRDLVNKMLADAPQPIKKEGTTVIEKNGKTYVYVYKKRKRK